MDVNVMVVSVRTFKDEIQVTVQPQTRFPFMQYIVLEDHALNYIYGNQTKSQVVLMSVRRIWGVICFALLHKIFERWLQTEIKSRSQNFLWFGPWYPKHAQWHIIPAFRRAHREGRKYFQQICRNAEKFLRVRGCRLLELWLRRWCV